MCDLIEKMAKAHWNHMRGDDGRKWEDLNEITRVYMYDAMWEALGELRKPNKAMVGAGVEAVDPEARTVWGVGEAKMFTSMIDKLREVE